MNLVDVVIPVYIREQKHLAMSIRCINRAREMTNIKYNAIIVETASNYLSEYADIYIYERNRTTADKSINRAFFCCDSQYTVLLTNDVEVEEGWLEALLEPFDKFEDCGISTLGSNQFGHTKKDRIEEGIWGSVFCIESQYAQFDENYINSWEDSDLWMQMYCRGYKMYRNYNCIVKHDPGQTVYGDKMTQDNYERNRQYFINKWKDIKDPNGIRMFNILTQGTIV